MIFRKHNMVIKSFSIRNKLLYAIFIWLFCGISFMVISINISWKIEEIGVEINQAGSLRKRVYYVTLLSQQAQMKEIFHNEIKAYIRLLQDLEGREKKADVRSQAKEIRKNFLSFIQYLEIKKSNRDMGVSTLKLATKLTEEIDVFVKNIEDENTENIRMFRKIQVILIFMIILSAFLSFIFLRKLIIEPLCKIKKGIEELTDGKLNSRVILLTHDEFSDVSEGFNRMASIIEGAYTNLENKVEEKTLALEKKDLEWKKLYEITSFVHEKMPTQEIVHIFLTKIMQLLPCCSGCIKIVDVGVVKLDLDFEVEFIGDDLKKIDKENLIKTKCMEELSSYNAFDNKDVFFSNSEGVKFANFLIKRSGKIYGLLVLSLNEKTVLLENNILLINMLCTQLAIAIENMNLTMIEKQVAILEERNIIAQGLHDSIAQSLSFLNIQVQMLVDANNKNNKVGVLNNIEFIQNGIQQCYEDVRELLNNFRMKLINDNFLNKIKEVINRYQSYIKAKFHLSILDENIKLSPEQQLQVIFIIQEVLSNVRKHAQANNVYIVLSNKDGILISIKDDGIGFNSQESKDVSAHIGLKIIRERADKINANILIQSGINKGTQIDLNIR